MAAKNRVLFVDDSAEIRQAMSGVIRGRGFELEICTDGAEATELVLRKHQNGEAFDLIITDFQMPKMDGCEFVSAIQKKGVSTPVLMMTGAPEQAADKHRALELRNCSIIVKYNFDSLDHVLSQVLKE